MKEFPLDGTILYLGPTTSKPSLGNSLEEAGYPLARVPSVEDALNYVGSRPKLILLEGTHPANEIDKLQEKFQSSPNSPAVPMVQIQEEQSPPSVSDVNVCLVSSGGHLKPTNLSLLHPQTKEQQLCPVQDRWYKLFGAINEGICVVDLHGKILECNAPMAAVFGKDTADLVGQSLRDLFPCLEVIPNAIGLNSNDTSELQLGDRHFLRKVDPIWDREGSLTGAALILLDITQYKEEKLRADVAEAEVHEQIERIRMLETEVQRLEQLTSQSSAVPTTRVRGDQSLQQAAPELFDAAVRSYAQLLDASLRQKHYQLTPALSEELRGLADHLGAHDCGPKDVIEIHKETLSLKRSSISSLRFWGYISEGRLLLLELMGYLGNHYRFRVAAQPVGP
ncbi:MAG: PAS domain-containing protein [Gemmataceae bacterium]